MHRRPLRRATILALTGLLAFAGSAMADQLLADGDVLTPQVEGTRALGNVAAGAEVSVDVGFVLTCVGLGHVDPGQSVLIGWTGGGSKPPGGDIVSVTSATLNPLTTGWAPDGQGCPDPVPSQPGGAYSHVTLRAPTVPALGYMYTVVFTRSLDPGNASDGSAFSRSATQVSFTMNVVANTRPTLTVPASFQVEGNTTGGWTAAWGGVSAIDVEDDPDPTPSCSPAAGTVIPLGPPTHVTCSVSDSAGASASGAFDVTVVDTTAPVLAGMPGDQSLTTSDPGGAVATYASPSASDIVDPSPTVACSPASGSNFGVGPTNVTCTATDASGNSSSASFTVEERYLAPNTASAIWLEPVGGGQDAFEANHSRTIPVKVRLFVDGVERSSGHALLTLTPCGGGPAALELPMSWNGGRWNAALDTSMLPGPCYTVSASIDGLVAGSFRLELRGDTVAAKTRSTQASSTPPRKAGHSKPR